MPRVPISDAHNGSVKPSENATEYNVDHEIGPSNLCITKPSSRSDLEALPVPQTRAKSEAHKQTLVEIGINPMYLIPDLGHL